VAETIAMMCRPKLLSKRSKPSFETKRAVVMEGAEKKTHRLLQQLATLKHVKADKKKVRGCHLESNFFLLPHSCMHGLVVWAPRRVLDSPYPCAAVVTISLLWEVRRATLREDELACEWVASYWNAMQANVAGKPRERSWETART
jgi:hypothetical protein